MTYREFLLGLANRLEITDEEAGEPQWAAYLSDRQLADAIRRLRPDADVPSEEAR